MANPNLHRVKLQLHLEDANHPRHPVYGCNLFRYKYLPGEVLRPLDGVNGTHFDIVLDHKTESITGVSYNLDEEVFVVDLAPYSSSNPEELFREYERFGWRKDVTRRAVRSLNYPPTATPGG